MLPKKYKLGTKLFKETFKEGLNNHSNFIHSKKMKVKTGDLKIAVVAPSKIFKKAYQRNKIRRQGYNLIKKNLNLFEKGFYYIFFIKKEIPSIKIYEKEILNLIKK